VTRRTNSVFTAGHEDLPLADLERFVAAAERFYADRGLPAVFQISAATGARGLDALLETRGYRVDGPSEVWTAHPLPTPPPPAQNAIVRTDDPSTAWLDVAFADDPPERRRVHEAIAARAPRPRAFTSLVADGRIAACAMAVAGGTWAGLFCMTTRPDARRRGLGRAIVADVCRWATAQGGTGAYLQVMCENEGAKALYHQAGFRPGYGYHYRVNPITP
jgi:ribosomal protein S18 acetylase RimI-like enzyme